MTTAMFSRLKEDIRTILDGQRSSAATKLTEEVSRRYQDAMAEIYRKIPDPQMAKFFADSVIERYQQEIRHKSAVLPDLAESVARLSAADPKDVSEIAASQIQLLTGFYALALSQATRSFKWALRAGIAGAVVILLSLVLLFTRPLGEWTSVSAVLTTTGGLVVEGISALLFYLYGKTSAQLGDFHSRLDRTQRYLLANTVCESLEGDYKQNARRELVGLIAARDAMAGDSRATPSS